jgi:CheY-like chemotaxis protein
VVSFVTPFPASSGTVSLSGLRVLLVEDTWIIAQSYAALLEPMGVVVLGPAANVADAIVIAGEGAIDAALIDINLQGEFAYDLIDRLHQARVPVVVVTGYEILPRVEGKTVAILKKPIRAEQLLRALRSVAEQVRARTPASS